MKAMGTKKSIFTYILLAFLFLIATAGFLFGVATVLSNFVMQRMQEHYNYEILLEQQSGLLEQENYSKFRFGKLSGRDYFEILDTDGRLIYSSKDQNKKKTHAQYDLEELTFIPDITSENYVIAEKTKEDGMKRTVISVYSYYDGSTEDTLQGILLLDEDNNVLYTTFDRWQEHYSNRELKFWAEEMVDGYNVRKAEFETKNGDWRYILFYHKPMTEQDYSQIARIPYYFFAAFLLVFGIILYLLVRWIQNQFQKPLDSLERALAEVANGSRTQVLEGGGPEEFVRIYDSFHKMQEQIAESEEKRMQLERNKQKMIADISHDLKTPITVIAGYTAALQDDVIPKDMQKKYLYVIHKKCEMLSELANTFYSYSELEHPDYVLKKSEGDICEYLRAYLAGRYEEIVSVHGLDLDFQIPEEQIMWQYDEVQLKRGFENIVANTLKYAKKGTKIYASLEKIQMDGKVRIQIRIGDDGMPIPQEIREHIFEPFVVGDEARSSGQGSGLGMAISKKIVELHGGSVCLLPAGAGGGTNVYEILL